VARILGEAGYHVATLADALTALEVLEGGQYDLLITNSVMSGARGAKLVARVRERHPQLPVLHLDDGAHPAPDEFPGDVPTLLKPFSSLLLLDQVRQILGRSTD
jgi:two-component system chemotaxis response regulator CheY